MSATLGRHSYDNRRSEIRRIVVAGAWLLVMSTAWYAVRPSVIRRMAQSSIGCAGRSELLAAGLREDDPSFPEDRDLFGEDRSNLYSHCLPRPGWVAWPSGFKERRNPDGSHMTVISYFNYADHRLQGRGRLSWQSLSEAPPGDMDGDGRWEIVLEKYMMEPEEPRDIRLWAVIRLGVTGNEVAWIGLVDANLWAKTNTRIKPIWRDEDNDGVEELLFVTVVYVVLPGGRGGFHPPKTVATFEWDSPGGTLIPRHLPDDCGILPWVAPEARPVSVGQDTELTPVLEALHPLPDDFGTPWPPASSTATSLPPSAP